VQIPLDHAGTERQMEGADAVVSAEISPRSMRYAGPQASNHPAAASQVWFCTAPSRKRIASNWTEKQPETSAAI
jgi:hypothetical protein